ncbi:MAG TPA: DUF1684 domain-containing protein [Actinomycetota bacterium]|nr:DUF1684 domain-containing protein [Actinomycetota bacterium]
MEARDHLDLLDWKRRILALYAEVRSADDHQVSWGRWREVRRELITTHPQSPIREPDRRAAFEGPWYFEHDPAYRTLAEVEGAEPERVVIEGSADGRFAFTRFGWARFELQGEPHRLALHWLEGYGGGVFLSFRDATSGRETYGACRYLLDTVKGADLGMDGDRLILDFNFAYQPSCSYDPAWACPLAPPDNRLAVPVRAGERLGPG